MLSIGQIRIFQIPWQRIVNATEMVASSHETFAQKIEEDVERPLRDYHTKNRELASLPGVQSDLATLAKNLEASLKKVDKAREKGPKGADKLAGAVAASEGVRQEWESRAPFAFEQLQAADESRLNHLRDALTQLETHESDQVERCRQATETCLNVLLNVETADEIRTFAEKVNGGRPVVLSQQTSPTPVAPPGPPPRLHDDTASQRSETSGPIRTPPAPEPQPRHSTPLGGLKRLGTVMNRRKSIMQPSGGAAFFSDKKHRSPFASFKRGDSRDMQIPESLPDEERPGTALTTQENHNEVTRIPSETNDHEGHGTMTSIPTTHSVPTTANGTTSPEPPAETGIAISDSHQRAQQTGVRRNVGTLRGRRDVRNTVFIPNPPQASDAPTLQSGSDVSMPVSPGLASKHAASPSIATEDHALSDTTSVRSGHTLHGSSGAIAHPDLHEPGLNASIIETVNAWFSDGVVTKSSVIGELALAYNGTPEPNTTVRLENFQVLEKVAANPHFVNEEKDKDLSDEKRGQYSIHVPTISRPSPTVAFKYQLHVDASDSSAYCPVIFKPVWNIEEHQASVIIFYSLNPSFTSSAPKESITLKNLVLTVNLDTSPEEGREVAHATNAVMYPNTGASFRRKHSAVTWKMPEFEVKAGSDGKLLVRFSTATSWPRKGKVDAKFEVNTLDAGSRLGISAALPAEASTPKGSDPFADEDSGAHDDTQPSLTWKEVPTTRKLVGGKYVSS
ncbi:Muniscin C-terminal mu homology domain-containing protein [Aspergillus pseudonomiae]|uniref:Muniscin C-terminal mu homology domain-containing protein n=1 Tax=Aspergillus pseudonomiae TaxID=1506151 RepID=A0A5N7D882_9EURO|nr:Muniscin C-terminal mu homology domain-containing protein [Aspergillus pseudonomiae]KAE8402621.1 Muniscin C-terminal mu homology domain-containing protein [Aspergillus pseudonomiae]